VGGAIAEALRAQGAPCGVVAHDAEPTAAALHGAEEIVYLRGLDTLAPADQERSLGGALALVQALPARSARLWLVSQGAQGARQPVTAPEQAALWGFGATVVAEHPELRCIRIDLDPAHDARKAAAALVRAATFADGEDQVALRGDDRLVARLVPAAGGAVAADAAVRLASDRRGVLDSLELVPMERRAPGAGEIEIRVHVTGQNFRDVLVALDLYPEYVPTFGEECSGEVVRVGAGVDALHPGDRVMAMGSGAFASYVTTDADLAIRLPGEMAFDAAATIPIAFLTAHYALLGLGRLRAGDRVLVHAGAGGVGMAAVQLAQRAGAEVYATAGSDEKRDLLRSLGVRHVFDSRSLDFVTGVRTATGGAGVDVVLNSLSGEFIEGSLELVAPGGRFLEIGKRDILTSDEVAARRPDVAYAIVFLGDLSRGDPPAIQSMLRELMPRFAAGELTPLPRTEFSLDDAVSAFRYMAQARHAGKVVVRHPVAPAAITIDGDSTYLVTGGLGGIGLVLARHLVERGARTIALAGRHGPTEAAAPALAAMAALGADVRCFQADVSEHDDAARLLAQLDGTLPPLRGIIHAAGVTDDAALAAQTWERFAGVLAPKVAGARLLDRLTGDRPLDFFVLISSAAGVLGSAGQAGYAAANAVLDAMAMQRRADGRPVTSISWGPWDRVGMTERVNAGDLDRMARHGLRLLTPAQGAAAFDGALAAGRAHVVAAALDRGTLPARPVLAALRRPGSEPELVQGQFRDELTGTAPTLRRSALAALIGEQASKVLGLPLGTGIAPRQPFSELGLDSLMAVELRNAIGTALGIVLPATLLFDFPTTSSLADHLVGVLFDGAPVPSDDAPIDDIASLTEEEAEALLLAELSDSEAGR
jgi:NADPH:quinone reductase-like Zn-dependent oxidoreductase/acyl carrier protein